MPTYAYACRDCHHRFDIVQSFSDDSLTVCPECNGTLRKQFDAVGVVFKGSGFYRTDSRGSESKDTSSSDSSGPADSASSSKDSGSSSKDSGSPTKDSSGSSGSSSSGSLSSTSTSSTSGSTKTATTTS